MSVFKVKGRGWRYNFYFNKKRYQSNPFSTKAEAKQAEAQKRNELGKQTIEKAIKRVKRLGDNRWIIERWHELNPKERQAVVFTIFQGRCHYCGRKVHIQLARKKTTPDRCILDHKVPFAHGGPDSFDNIVLSCEECNQKKLDQSYEEFIGLKE